MRWVLLIIALSAFAGLLLVAHIAWLLRMDRPSPRLFEGSRTWAPGVDPDLGVAHPPLRLVASNPGIDIPLDPPAPTTGRPA